MAEDELVTVEIERPYPRGGVTYQPGATIDVPPHVADHMEDQNPPYGRRVDDEGSGVEADRGPAFSGHALKLLEKVGADPDEYDGPASGADGRVLKSDVEEWLDEVS